jgi:hypothetical protein
MQLVTRMQELQESRRGTQWHPRVEISVGNTDRTVVVVVAVVVVAKGLTAREGWVPYCDCGCLGYGQTNQFSA